MRRLKRFFRSYRPVYRVSLIVVDHQNNGEPFPEEVWERIRERLRELGNYTCYKTFGGWEEDGKLIEEPGTLYYWIVQGEEKVQDRKLRTRTARNTRANIDILRSAADFQKVG